MPNVVHLSLHVDFKVLIYLYWLKIVLCQDFNGKVDELSDLIEKISKQSFKDPREARRDLAAQKKKMLEASVFALQEGDGLIASLQQAMGSNPLIGNQHKKLFSNHQIALKPIFQNLVKWQYLKISSYGNKI